MPYSALALRQTIQAISTTFFELKAPGGVAPSILEICLMPQAQLIVGLGKPTFNCTGPTSVPFQNDNPNEPATNVTGAVSYSSNGGVPDNYYRRAVTVNAVSGVVWVFPRGLRVPRGTTMCIWNIAASTATTDFHVVIEE